MVLKELSMNKLHKGNEQTGYMNGLSKNNSEDLCKQPKSNIWKLEDCTRKTIFTVWYINFSGIHEIDEFMITNIVLQKKITHRNYA